MESLPELCIATVISFTSPRDACRFSSVNSVFKSAADSDAVWDSFLPADYRALISDSDFSSSSSSPSSFPSKKELYLSLCHNPILIDESKMSFQLDKQSGKKCYMISAWNHTIVWCDTPNYWYWTSTPGSRFPEVAHLIDVRWFQIRGKINTSILSPNTTYGAYLVFKSAMVGNRFHNEPVEVTFGVAGSESHKRAVYLYPERGQRQPQPQPQRMGRSRNGWSPSRTRRLLEWQGPAARENGGDDYPKGREDGWLEIELGEIFIVVGQKGELEMSVTEVTCDWKQGIIVQGIEIRPKQGN